MNAYPSDDGHTMGAKRFEKVTQAVGFETYRGVAFFFGVHERTVMRWIEENHIPRPVAMVLELMAWKKLKPERVLSVTGVSPKKIEYILQQLPDYRSTD